MNLESSAAALLEQFPEKPRVELQREEKMLERFGQIAFTGLGIIVGVAILGIIYAIVANMILTGQRPFFGLLLIVFIVFAGLSLGYVFWMESLKEKRAKLEMAPGRDLGSAGTTDRLLNESSFEPVPPSVVENTTELLTAKSKTRKLD